MTRDAGDVLNSWRNPSKAHNVFSLVVTLAAGHSLIDFSGVSLVYPTGCPWPADLSERNRTEWNSTSTESYRMPLPGARRASSHLAQSHPPSCTSQPAHTRQRAPGQRLPRSHLLLPLASLGRLTCLRQIQLVSALQIQGSLPLPPHLATDFGVQEQVSGGETWACSSPQHSRLLRLRPSPSGCLREDAEARLLSPPLLFFLFLRLEGKRRARSVPRISCVSLSHLPLHPSCAASQDFLLAQQNGRGPVASLAHADALSWHPFSCSENLFP
ncbi:uncharacterized protein LOC120389069 [Mauremys reevesii]|uniref:uncharacterized protein LOC120389069 n=1 Tax=Mauremys reevesii TaxID=260615 RepID=UPI00193F03E9|nr:uncharacterized protein LOC120389069 [Mauremys reevesii]